MFFNIIIGVLLAIHVLVCILLVLIVLMQRPRSEGLGTAFGGGVADTLFGSSAGNVLTKITTWLGIIFFVTTISLAFLYSHRPTSSGLGSKLKAGPSVPTKETNPSAPPSSEKTSSPQQSAPSSPPKDSSDQKSSR